MSKIWFYSDPHLGHSRIIQYCNRPFSSVEEMDEALLKNYNTLVTPEDTVYWLGDVTWYQKKKLPWILPQFNGRKFLIRGNHDNWENMKPYFEWIKDYYEVKEQGVDLVLMHYPILSWNRCHHGSIHLHGHTHGGIDNSGTLRFDVGVDCFNYTPVSLDEIVVLAGKRQKQDPAICQKRVQKFDELYTKASNDTQRESDSTTGS